MKITSILLSLLFVAFALVQLNDDYWLPWTVAYLFSAYTAACSARNYFNPMLLMLMVTGYLIGFLFSLPSVPIADWLHQEQQAASFEMKMPFVEEARESLGLLICALVNYWYMKIGMRKAKQPLYNEEFSVSARNK